MRPCPLILEPRLLAKPWGGRSLQSLGKSLPAGAAIGESWEVYDDEQGSALVAGGPARHKTLRQLCRDWGADLLGPGHADWARRFPLQVKLIDAREDLSLQVHPTDALAAELEGPAFVGKSELMLLLQSSPGAGLYSGFRPGASPQALAQALREGRPQELLNFVELQPGQAVDIPAGRPHALGAGCLVAEVSQNSDLTYRFWDWGRLVDGRPRPLHPEQSLRALRFDEPFASASGLCAPSVEDGGWELLQTGSHFSTRRLRLEADRAEALEPAAAPRILLAFGGGGAALRLEWEGGALDLPAASTAILPACLGALLLPLTDSVEVLCFEPR